MPGAPRAAATSLQGILRAPHPRIQTPRGQPQFLEVEMWRGSGVAAAQPQLLRGTQGVAACDAKPPSAPRPRQAPSALRACAPQQQPCCPAHSSCKRWSDSTGAPQPPGSTRLRQTGLGTGSGCLEGSSARSPVATQPACSMLVPGQLAPRLGAPASDQPAVPPISSLPWVEVLRGGLRLC